jgi:hypothetical protein
MKELHDSSSLMKEILPSNYSISAIFFDKFPLLFHLTETIPTPSLTIDFLEKLKTHEFVLDEFVKEDYYLPPPEALNTDNILHIASTTLGYPYEKTWKTVNKLVRGGLVFANINTHSTTTENSSMVQQQTAQYIRSNYGDAYVKETVDDCFPSNNDNNNNMNEDERKESIYPTSVARVPTPEDDPLYTLIWERTIQSSMTPAYYHRYRLTILLRCTPENPVIGKETKVSPTTLPFVKKTDEGWGRILLFGSAQPTQKYEAKGGFTGGYAPNGGNLGFPTPNMSFVHFLDVPIFRGWTRMTSSLTPSLSSLEHGIHPTTPHNVLLYLQSLNRGSPIYCKRVIAESRVSPEIPPIEICEGEVVEKLKELGIGMEAIRRAGFFQIHKKMGLVKDLAPEGGGGEGFVLSFEKGREIESFKETRMKESPERTAQVMTGLSGVQRRGNKERLACGNRIVLNGVGLACAEHFHNTYRYLLDSKEYITPPTIEKSPANISNELNNYINERIEKHMANGGDGGDGRLIGQYRGTELRIKRNEGGRYLEWGKEPHFQRKSLESIPLFDDLDEKGAIEIIERGMRELENSADYKRVFRILDPYTSIRHGKFGTYIYHRTEEMKKTKFISLKKCQFNYMTAPVEEIMEWVYQRLS